jgi:tetratricopeptide (TPR) repeat protein
MAWAAGGVSNAKLTKIVQSRGSALTFSSAAEREFRSAGISPELLAILRSIKSAGGSNCPASLAKAAALSHDKKYEEAGELLSRLLQDDPRNGSLHFALAYLKQQQGDWDSAFDEYSTAKEKEPDFSEVHNRLALVFYQGDDAENTIGEARTALSMNFQDPEAYHMLGLGHYANEQYGAAMNAFEESLARDPANANVYYEMGLVARDQGSDDQAIQSFRKSLQLDLNFGRRTAAWEPFSARKNNSPKQSQN